MRSILTAGYVILVLLLSGLPALAQTAPAPVPVMPVLAMSGGERILKLTASELAQLPQVEEAVTFKTSKGISTARYKGPLLWDVLTASKLLEGLEHNGELAKTLLVTATDGYRIAFSVGELSPEFGNATILLALETDGKPSGLRIVAQGDKRGARAIHDIVSIELR